MRRRHQLELIQSIRQFFQEKDFLEVLTPPMVENPGMETHIHPFQVYSAYKKQLYPLYLHTSPEFCLKEILADAKEENLSKVYSLAYCFRDEPTSSIHRSQFLMLEWYRLGERYEKIMDDVESLIQFCLDRANVPKRKVFHNLKFTRMTMSELWLKTIGVDPLEYLEASKLRELIKSQFPDIPLPSIDLSWDDLFFLLHLNKVEAQMSKWPLLLITEFPAPLAALSTIKPSDPRVCERFEVYINGVEICNSYNELIDANEQRKRFEAQSKEKKSVYGYDLPAPTKFLKALDKGLPPCAGIALGVERLLSSLFIIENPFFD